MPPGGSRQDKKARDVGRADAGRGSTSRNTTPSSVAGRNSVDPTATTTSPFFHTRLHTNSGSYKAKPALGEAIVASVAPESGILRQLAEHGKFLDKETQKDLEELLSLEDKLIELRHELGSKGPPAAKLKEEDEDQPVKPAPEKMEGVVIEIENEKTALVSGKKAKNTKRKKPGPSIPAERPLTHGAHSVAVQDGSHIDKKSLGASRDPDTASSSLSPAQTPAAAAAATVPDQDVDAVGRDENMEEVQPLPARVLVEKPTFGDDPTKFDDPTVYEITKIQPGMTDDQIKEIASVKSFPRNDLSQLTAGAPPDRDFSNNKPANQVQGTTFATYSEQYLRPFTEEDMSFLRDRGDRITPFTMPALGKRSYKQLWAEEDGSEAPEDAGGKRYNNEARGSIEDMNDAIAETDELSAGASMNRVLGLLRNEHRQLEDSTDNAANATNGEEDGNNDELAAILEGSSKPTNSRAPLTPATRIAEPQTEPGKKYVVPNLSGDEQQRRLIQELTYAGLLPENAEPVYGASLDDGVAAQIRKLQAQLKIRSLENAARKAILQDRMSDQMAYQEYTHIGDDLDAQVTNAYQKRSRTMGKKNKKRSGGAGGGANAVSGNMVGVAKPGLEGATKIAMDRRKNWKEKVGSVFDDPTLGKVPRASDPGSSIFTKEAMAKAMAKAAAQFEEEDADADDE